MEDDKETASQYAVNKYLWIVGAILLLVFGYMAMRMVSSSFDDYKLTLVNALNDAKAGSPVTYTWKIDGPQSSIYHTAIYFGQESVPGEIGKDVAPVETKYDKASLVDFNYGKYKIPLQFIGNIKFGTTGKYYYRLHALIKDKNFWSEEYSIEIK